MKDQCALSSRCAQRGISLRRAHLVIKINRGSRKAQTGQTAWRGGSRPLSRLAASEASMESINQTDSRSQSRSTTRPSLCNCAHSSQMSVISPTYAENSNVSRCSPGLLSVRPRPLPLLPVAASSQPAPNYLVLTTTLRAREATSRSTL